jgi:SAM-dependent methyltransferase
LTTRLNPDCDILLVDSASPYFLGDNFKLPPQVKYWSFPDNVGHLSRRGRDGWGRAFCKGLQFAIDGGYDYAVHIEGDSLLRLPVMPIAEQMRAGKIKVASTEVGGMRNAHLRQWVETGLMAFDVGYVRDSGFIRKYDWEHRQAAPTPENVIWRILGKDLTLMPWRTQRGDKRQITAQTVAEYDWITHCWGFDDVYAAFAASVMPRTLLFATTYIPDAARAKLLDDWLAMAQRIGGSDCDVLMVDTPANGHAPVAPAGFHAYEKGMRLPKMLHRFPDNIGHLQDDDSERDGWGRAFCFGLRAAIDGSYEYVVHVEGDSLFRLPLRPIVKQMRDDGIDAASVLSVPGRPYCVEVETGLMMFSTKYLKDSDFIARYDWPSHRMNKPSPESIIHGLLGDKLRLMPWRARRGYNPNYAAAEVDDLDWITHAHERALYDRFIEGKPAMLKVNLGCGDNKLEGWKNHDRDVDITKRLPFADGSVDRILAEHVVEHVTYVEAIEFFRECRRVLRPDGVVRIAVPSVKGATVRGAMHSIIYNFGHKAPWTLNLLQVTLYFAGFKNITCHRPGESGRADLKNVEGHHRAITKAWNDIETVVCEAQPEK